MKEQEPAPFLRGWLKRPPPANLFPQEGRESFFI